MMEPSSTPGPGGVSPQLRVSDQDRDAVVQRLQAAFAEGRLDDSEFDQRTRTALSARTAADLSGLYADLSDAAGPPPALAPAGPGPGRFALAYKGPVRFAGRWRVPEKFTSVVYKGTGSLDLRVAELTGPVTTIRAVAYKSRIDIIVPPGVRVELEGIGASRDWAADGGEGPLSHDAPVLHIRGIAYKGSIEVSTRPPGAGAGQLPAAG
jgi:Domain of unknown function (DUF1707)